MQKWKAFRRRKLAGVATHEGKGFSPLVRLKCHSIDGKRRNPEENKNGHRMYDTDAKEDA